MWKYVMSASAAIFSSLMLSFLQLLTKIYNRMLMHQVVNKVNIISEKHLHFGTVGMLAH